MRHGRGQQNEKSRTEGEEQLNRLRHGSYGYWQVCSLEVVEKDYLQEQLPCGSSATDQRYRLLGSRKGLHSRSSQSTLMQTPLRMGYNPLPRQSSKCGPQLHTVAL